MGAVMCNLFKIVNIRNFLTTEVCHTAYSHTCNCHLPFGLCKCFHGRTPRKTYRKAAACSECGCKS